MIRSSLISEWDACGGYLLYKLLKTKYKEQHTLRKTNTPHLYSSLHVFCCMYLMFGRHRLALHGVAVCCTNFHCMSLSLAAQLIVDRRCSLRHPFSVHVYSGFVHPLFLHV